MLFKEPQVIRLKSATNLDHFGTVVEHNYKAHGGPRWMRCGDMRAPSELKLTGRKRAVDRLADHATLRNSTVGPPDRDDQTSADLEAQGCDTEEEVLLGIVVRYGDLGNERHEPTMPERERSGPVTGFSFTNQPPRHLTSHARYPGVESSDNSTMRAVAARVGKTRPPIAPPQTFVARVSETLRPLSVHRQVSAAKRRRRAVRSMRAFVRLMKHFIHNLAIGSNQRRLRVCTRRAAVGRIDFPVGSEADMAPSAFGQKRTFEPK